MATLLPTPAPTWRAAPGSASGADQDWNAYLRRLEAERKLYPGILSGISRIETGHLPDEKRDRIRSPAGAQGYWQFMPATAARFGYRDTSDRWDGARAAADYLATMRDQFAAAGLDPTPDLLGAGYNAGEGAVLKHGGIPPYQETQKYARLMRQYVQAPRLAEQPAAPPAGAQEPAPAGPMGLPSIETLKRRFAPGAAGETPAPAGPFGLPSITELKQSLPPKLLAPAKPAPFGLPSIGALRQRFNPPVVEGRPMQGASLPPDAMAALRERILTTPSPKTDGGLPPGYPARHGAAAWWRDLLGVADDMDWSEWFGLKQSLTFSTPTEVGDVAGLPPGYPINEMRAAPGDRPGFGERVASAFRNWEGLSENALDWAMDRIPAVNPLTGKPLTPEEKREARVAFEEWLAQRDAVPSPETLPEYLAQFIGIAGKEMADPAALLTMRIGEGATGLARLGKMFLAGAGYETAASTVEQAADRGTVDPGEVAKRAAIGGAAAVGLDQLVRAAGKGLAALRRAREAGAPEEVVSAAEETLRTRVREAAAADGLGPEQADAALDEAIGTVEVDPQSGRPFLVPRPEQPRLDAPGAAPEPVPAPRPELPTPVPQEPPLAVPVGAPRVTPAPRPAPQADALAVEPPLALPAPAAEGRVQRLLDAAEAIEQTAQTSDATTAAVLRRQADLLRREASGADAGLTRAELQARRKADLGAQTAQRNRERLARLRVVDAGKDDLLTAIRKLGGIDTSLETDWAGRFTHLPRRQGMLGGIERPGSGRSLDDLAERLHELGYLRAFDQDELADLLDRAQTGNPVWALHVSPEDAMGDLAARWGADDFGSDRAVEWVPDGTSPDPVESGMTIVEFDDGTQGLVRTRGLTDDDWTRIERERAQWEADQAADDAKWQREIEIERRAEAGEPAYAGPVTPGGPAAAEPAGGRAAPGPGPGVDDAGAGAAGQADRGQAADAGRVGAQPDLRADAAQGLNPVDDLVRPKLSELSIEQTVDGKATGTRIPADKALAHVDNRLALAARLLECLGGA